MWWLARHPCQAQMKRLRLHDRSDNYVDTHRTPDGDQTFPSMSSNLRIWLITVGEPLPIPGCHNPRLLRTGRLARCLTDRGHEVLWWTSAFDHFTKRHHTPDDANFEWEGGQLRLLRSTGYRKNVSIRRFIEHAGIARKFAREARMLPPPNLILVSLPTIELAHAAVEYGRAAGVPVLVDIRDLWPDIMIDVLPQRWRWLSRMLLSSQVRRAHEAMARCDALIAVSEGYLQWGLRYANRARQPLDVSIPLGYVAPQARRQTEEVGHQLARIGVRQEAMLCWYVGTFGRQYDLAPVIKAAHMFQAAGRNDVQFVISGEGELGPRWHAQAAGLRNVVFTGWIGADEINWLRSHAALGLQPYAKGAPQGLANKLFEYLSAGLPVVSSLAGENEQLIREHHCGLTYRAADAADCHRQLSTLLDDSALRQRMGAEGQRLFETQFNATSVFERLMNHIETAASGHVPQEAPSAATMGGPPPQAQ
jgi:glycosyltransferase involved in cell wall biosynthesis